MCNLYTVLMPIKYLSDSHKYSYLASIFVLSYIYDYICIPMIERQIARNYILYACMYVYIYICLHINTYIHVVHTYRFMYVCLYTCICHTGAFSGTIKSLVHALGADSSMNEPAINSTSYPFIEQVNFYDLQKMVLQFAICFVPTLHYTYMVYTLHN